MGCSRQTVVATLPSTSDHERIELVLCHQPGQAARLQLRQQSWGDGVGWFTQSSIELEPEQVAGLKLALGPVGRTGRSTTPAVKAAPVLRLVQADSA